MEVFSRLILRQTGSNNQYVDQKRVDGGTLLIQFSPRTAGELHP